LKAVRIHAYGAPDVLRVEEVEAPHPGPRDVLVRVCATSVNPVDCKIRGGGQRNVIWYRLPWILGLDVSGVVEAVGAQVTRFKVGDEVWSSPTHRRPGTYAERLCIDEREVARKPKNLTHDEAACLPLVGLTAYQCLVDKGRLQKGQTVLIHAGAGGVGSFAIQLARHLGARVITTCSAKNAELVRSLGADRAVDYTKERFEDAGPVDLVLDSLGEEALAANIKVLRSGGRMSNITVDLPRHVARYGRVLSLFTVVAVMIWVHLVPLLKKGIRVRHVIKRCDGEQLQKITELVELGAIKPVIDRVLPLEEICAAHTHSESHRARGKIVLHVADR
jgi:alcohol dehydrogenase